MSAKDLYLCAVYLVVLFQQLKQPEARSEARFSETR